MTVKLPYIRWRDGRPRSSHSARERDLGFRDEDLRHNKTGDWFSYEEAKAWSGEHKLQIEAARTTKRKVKGPSLPKVTVSDLLEDWTRSDEFLHQLSPVSRRSYHKGIAAIRFKPLSRSEAAEFRRKERAAKLLGVPMPQRDAEDIASVTPTSIGKPELRAFFNYLRKARGHHMAIAVISTLSAALTWGSESPHWRLPPNPREGMVFDRPKGRVVLVEMVEFQAWVAATDAIERASIGDSFYLGLFTGQRQTDRLMMRNASETEGRHAFTQSKTGEMVDIKEAPQLTARLDAARARVARIKLRLGLAHLPSEIVVNEENGLPYDDSTYRHWVTTAREVATFGWLARMDRREAIDRAAALAAELRGDIDHILAKYPLDHEQSPAERNRALEGRSRALRDWQTRMATRDSNGDASAWRLAPCPSLLFINADGDLDAKHDQDLRDTCVMLLDRAGCDLLTICDITGHSYKSAQTIVKHYRARNAARADEGIDRLVLQVRKEGMAG